MKTSFAPRTLSLALAALLTAGSVMAQSDPVVLSFSTVGDSRQDSSSSKVDPTQAPLSGQDAHWLQNSKAWSRIMREVSAKKSNLLFFNGDMVMGYGDAGPVSATDVTSVLNSDLVKFHTQYAFWRGMVAPLIENGTYVVPVPGNHETQCNSANTTCLDANGNNLSAVNGGKNAVKVNEDAWRANMADLIVDATRLNNTLPGGLTVTNVDNTDHASVDSLTTPQNQLSYSFDVGNSHFAVINTDPTGGDSTAPSAWLAADFSAASGRGAQHFFVFGHKPAYTYDFTGNGGKAGGLDAIPAKRNTFWNVIEQYGAAYFCGHQHTFNMRQPVKADGTTSTAWQVIVGSGGSPFDVKQTAANQQPYDRYYAWANVRVFQSGKVQIDAYGFSDGFGATKLLQSAVLAH
ncbi:MAG: hypothetical protein EKK47_12940 [Burkholderiales bacterium]|nr:MAG: hypothetical protein EKK47_12940 [Burkholderiales bacterium]